MDPESVLAEMKGKIPNSDSKWCVKLYVDRFFLWILKTMGLEERKECGLPNSLLD